MNETTPLLNKHKKPSPWYIIIPLFCLTFAFSALYAPMIQFYTIIYCYKYYQVSDIGDNIPIENCAIPEVQSLASEAQAIIMFLTYTSTLIFASYYGSVSDRKGRRLVLEISTFGNVLLIASYILTFKFPNIFGVYLLFIAPVVRGIFAGDTVLIAAAQAYISDCTTPSERTLSFSYMLSSLFIGATLGPSVGSLLLKQTNSILSIFYLAISVNILFIFYIYFFLPESRDFSKVSNIKDEPKQSLLQRINIFSALSILGTASSKHANRYTLPILATIESLLNLVSLPPTVLYAMFKFNWTAYEGGFYVSVVGFARLLTTMLVLPLFSKLLHKSIEVTDGDTDSLCKVEATIKPSTSQIRDEEEEVVMEERGELDVKQTIIFDSWMIRTGCTFATVCFVAIGLSSTSLEYTIASAFHSLTFLANPSIRSLLTSLVDPSEVGQLLGAMTVLESFALILSQLSINSIYSISVGTMPELVFYVCAVITGLALILAFFVHPRK